MIKFILPYRANDWIIFIFFVYSIYFCIITDTVWHGICVKHRANNSRIFTNKK